MSSTSKIDVSPTQPIGQLIHQLVQELYPICRSITGNGVRETLDILKRYIPLEVQEIPSGTKVFDWTVPKEWNINDAYVKNERGERVIDFKKSNLHVVSYSVPVKTTMSLEKLKEHLLTLPEYPDWIPYRTSYYKESWGFCLSQNQLSKMPDAKYEVCIDSSLEEGYLTYGEYFLKGKTSDEILLSCHCCHPSLCNDNLSGIALATILAQSLTQPRRYSYRFLFIPATIGSISWLSLNEPCVKNIRHGLVVACVGDAGKCTYKRSRQGNTEIDRTASHVLKHSGDEYEILDFSPYGYDERQYCSPAFNLPVGSLTRTPHGQFPEYHTSADNLDFVQTEALADSFTKYAAILNILEGNKKYINQNPKCEPQLGNRGLYASIGGSGQRDRELAMLWVLNLSDGNHDLLSIAERSDLKFDLVKEAADALLGAGLLKECKEKIAE